MLKKSFIVSLLVVAVSFLSISAQSVKTISKGVVNGSAVSLPKPVYPPAAKSVRVSGAVNVQVLIDENGNVIAANAVSGHPLLRQSATEAAKAAKFKPTLLSGVPVKVTGVVVYNFVAPDVKDLSESKTPDENSLKTEKPVIEVLNGKALSLPKPVFPKKAKKEGAGGTVNVEVLIDEKGNVISAKAVSGHKLLREAAEKAALSAKFTPTLFRGNPVKIDGVIVYNFAQ